MTKPINRIIHAEGASTAQVMIYDSIGTDWWMGEVSAKDFTQMIARLGEIQEFDVHINCDGGSVFEALAMYTALNDHPAKINVFVDGVALSAAAFVAMAGDTITMAENALMMIHQARAATDLLTAGEMRSRANMLETCNTIQSKIFADRTGLPVDEVTTLVNAETWFTAAEAKAKGFCTAISPNKTVSAKADLTKFKNVPDWCRTALAQLSKEAPMPEPTPTPAPAPAPAPAPVATAPAPVPAPTPAPAPAAPVATVIDTKAEIQAALTAERKRAAEITALCEKAKHPKAAAAFIAEGLTVPDVQAKLFDQLVKDNVPVGDGGQPSGDAAPDPTAKAKAEFNAHKGLYAQLGVTEEQYVKNYAA